MLSQQELSVSAQQIIANGCVIIFPEQAVKVRIGDDQISLEIDITWTKDENNHTSRVEGSIINGVSIQLRWVNLPHSSLGATFLDPILIGRYNGQNMYLLCCVLPVNRDPIVRLFTYTVSLGESDGIKN